MKTIIARFQELKKPMDEIGEVDGEIVDANAIETALRSAGVALRNMQGEFRDFDDVIFELSEKWDSLDLMTQRYVATMAAGSRQQSRFIALVSNHARLMELTGYATNSAGAAAEQFAKTQESLQAKMNRLANAMDQFWTNLADSTVVKGAIDLATLFMNTINGIIKAFSNLPGVVGKAGGVFATFMVTLGGFKAAKGLIDGFFEHVVKGSLKAGRTAGIEMSDSINTTLDGKLKKTPGIITRAISKIDFKETTRGVDAAITAHVDKMEQEIKRDMGLLSRMFHSEGIMDDYEEMGRTLENMGEQSDLLRQSLLRQIPAEHLSLMDKKQAAMLLDNRVTGDQILLGKVKSDLELRHQAIEKGGLGALLTRIGLLQTANVAEAKGNVLLGVKNIISKQNIANIWAEVKARYALNTAMLKGAGVLLGLVGGVILVTKAISAMVKAAKDRTIEGQMEAAAAQTKKAAEAANEAKEAYDRLLGDQDKYTELQDTLSALTEGTEEWRDALIQANDQVLELLRNYPILADYMERDSQGRLTISAEGQRVIKEQGRQQVETAQMASLAAQLDQSILRREAVFKDSLKQGAGGPEMLRALIAAQEKTDTPIFKGGADSEELKKIREATGFSVDALLGLEDAFYHFTTTMDKVNRQIEKQAGLFFTSGLDPRAASSELGKSLSNIFSKGIFDSPMEERVKATADSITFATGRALGASNVAKELMSKYEVVVSDDTSQKDALKALYKAVTKQDSIPDEIAKDSKALKQEIARVVEMSRVSEDVKFLYDKILSLGEERAGEISALFSDGGKGLTREMAKSIQDIGAEQYLEEIASGLGMSVKELGDKIGLELDEFIANIRGSSEQATARYIKADEKAQRFGLEKAKELSDLSNEMDSDSYSNLIDKLGKIFAANGDISGILKEIDGLLLNITDKDKVKAILREVMSADWTDKDMLKGLKNSLQNIDSSIPEEALDIFISQMNDLNDAIYKTDMTSFINELIGVGKLIDSIRKKEDFTFSAEEYESIFQQDAALASDFIQNLDGTYTYIGDSMQSLIRALDDNTLATIEEQKKTLEEQIKASEILVRVEGLDGEMEGSRKVLAATLKAALEDLKGIDLAQLGIEGLSSETRIDRLLDEELKEILTKLFSLSTQLAVLREDQAKLIGLGVSHDYSERSPGELARSIVMETATVEEMTQMSNALIKQARDIGVTEVAVRRYNKGMADTDKLVRQAAAAELAFAIELRETEKRLEGLGSKATDHLETLKELDKGTREYSETLDILAEDFNKVFDTELDGSFFASEENLGNLTLALKGNQEAWEALLIAMDKAKVASYEFTTDYHENARLIEEITNALDQLEFSIDGEADMTGIMSALLAVGWEAERVAQFIESLGYSYVEFETKTEYKYVQLGPGLVDKVPIEVPVSFKAKKVSIPAAKRIPGFGSGVSTGGSKGGKEKETDPWKNSYDWLYNLVQKTNKEIRDRNRMEQDLNRILEGRNVTAKDIYDNMEKQVRSLEKQRDLLVQQRSGRLEEKQRIEVEYADVKGYASYNEQIGYVEIDWNKLEKLSDRKGNNEEAERVDAYIKELERIADTMNSIDDSLYDIEDQIDDILKMGKDDYLNLEDRILNAVVQAQRDLIDEMSAIHDSMTNANARVLDRLQEGIAASRRVREDTKIESDISAKEARLALLRQDTSRANQLEIMRLEEELTQDRQDYTDKLIDDKITELQMQNDAAAEQRQMQIDLANDQLEMSQKYGLLWERVEKLTRDGVDIQGELIKGSELESLLRRQEGFLGMSEIQKMEWTSELENQLASAVAYIQANNRQQESIFSQLAPGNIAKEPAKPGESGAQKPQTPPSTGSVGTAQTTSYYPKVTAAQVKAKGLDPNSIVDTLKTGGFASSHNEREKIAKANGIAGYTGTAAQNNQLRQLLNQGKLKRYKKGGLIDFTGPAWVDGSTTDPESILDAQDTRNLVALRDVLESLRRTGGGSGSSGDNYFDIRVQVDSLADDYDVDDLTNRIKKQIYDDATYRNVQVIRNLR